MRVGATVASPERLWGEVTVVSRYATAARTPQPKAPPEEAAPDGSDGSAMEPPGSPVQPKSPDFGPDTTQFDSKVPPTEAAGPPSTIR